MQKGLALVLLLAAAAVAVPLSDLSRADAQRSALRLARQTIAAALHVAGPAAGPLPAVRAGTFVTLEVGGHVRGCRGTLEPTLPTVAAEIQHNALAAALHDPAHRPLTAAELPRARISITVVERLISLPRLTAVLPQDGLVVRAGDDVGVVLPYEGRDPETRLRWGVQKAGLGNGASYDLYRMVAIRFAEGAR